MPSGCAVVQGFWAGARGLCTLVPHRWSLVGSKIFMESSNRRGQGVLSRGQFPLGRACCLVCTLLATLITFKEDRSEPLSRGQGSQCYHSLWILQVRRLFLVGCHLFKFKVPVIRGHRVILQDVACIAMASGGAALACFSRRALAGLPSPLLE